MQIMGLPGVGMGHGDECVMLRRVVGCVGANPRVLRGSSARVGITTNTATLPLLWAKPASPTATPYSNPLASGARKIGVCRQRYVFAIDLSVSSANPRIVELQI